MEPKTIRIPLSLSGRSDLNRLVREVARVDEFFLSNAARQDKTVQPPQLSRSLSYLAQENHINLLQKADRDFLKVQLETIVRQAPNLHLSFAAEPSPRALEQIVGWLRQNVHPQTMVVVGLQPNIAAGMVLRTPNKIFDMSMRGHLKKQEPYLVKLINEVAHG